MIEIKSIINDEILLTYLFKRASEDKHKNSVNYKNLEKRLNRYIDFHCVLYNNRPLCFGGMYKDPEWPDNIVRVLDRVYFFDIVRSKSLYKRPNDLNTAPSKIMLPLQTEIALSKSLIPFYSIQNYKRKKSMELSVGFYNENNLPKYTILPGVYCTTNSPHIFDSNKWQTVATLEQYKNDIPLPYLNETTANDMF